MSRSLLKDIAPSLEQLKLVVDALSNDSYSPTAAAVKTALLKADPTFDERSLGYKRFVDFLAAADAQGTVRLTRDVNNHPRVHRAGASPNQHSAVAYTFDGLRLRREVWRAFVEWSPGDYWRGWDRDFTRVFMAPQVGRGEAPWEAAPERFLAFPVVTQVEQGEWMKEFAAAQVTPVREALEASLGPDSGLGAFREALRSEGLLEAWSSALRHHVNLRAAEWATSAKVARHHLFESLARQSRPAPSDSIAVAEFAAEDAEDRGALDGVDSGIESLRRELHRVVDGLTLSELASTPVPARFLLGR